MGATWRIGVRDGERTALVRAGPFAIVRNPIFSCMLLPAAGLTAPLPDALTLASAVCLLVAIEIQMRVVEKPYLPRTHSEACAEYCRRVGRFVLGVTGTLPR